MGYSLRQLAKATGFTGEAIRHLVKQRVLPPATPRGRYTVYDEEHRLRLLALQKLEGEGFTRRAVAAKIDAASAEELAVLAGVAPPPAPAVIPAPPAPVPAPVKPPRPDTRVLVDGVVCVAADAMGVAPAAVRGALLAAIRRARELELGLGEIEEELAKGAKEAKAEKRSNSS